MTVTDNALEIMQDEVFGPVIPIMTDQSYGRIVNISSVAHYRYSGTGAALYSVTKTAIARIGLSMVRSASPAAVRSCAAHAASSRMRASRGSFCTW